MSRIVSPAFLLASIYSSRIPIPCIFCFDNGYKYLPPQFSLQASVISWFSQYLSQNYVRNVIFTVYLRLLILLCLSLYCRYNVIVNIVNKAANTY